MLPENFTGLTSLSKLGRCYRTPGWAPPGRRATLHIPSGSSEVSGLVPQNPQRTVHFLSESWGSLIVQQWKTLLSALKSKYFLWPHALLTPWSKLGSTRGIRAIQTHNFLFFSLALETMVFLRLWEDKKLGGWGWGTRHYLYSHFSKSHSNEWLYLWPRVTGNFRCS